MPITAAQLALGANYQIQAYASNDPIDQFTKDRPFTQWLVANKQDVQFGNGIFNEKVRTSNNSNYQNYTGDDQVTYNKKDTVRLAPYQHFEAHDGFTLNETELADNGIVMTDDKTAVPTSSEKIQIVNKLKENYATLKDGFQENFDLEVHRDGTQSTKAVPGLDLLVSTTPTAAQTVGGIDQSTNVYWQNNVSLAIAATAGVLTQTMEQVWRQCITFGKSGAPDKILCGSKFLDAYRKDALSTINRQLMIPGNKGVSVDSSVGNSESSGLYFKGVPVEWDPTFDTLQALLSPSAAWDKRCYFLNSKDMKLRPNQGRWLVSRKPPRIYDRYAYYFGLTADYGLTAKKRNGTAVLTIA